MTHKISLNNGKSFVCDSKTTIFEAARNVGITLEHSCLSARCRSCVVKIDKGNTIDKLDDLVLSAEEKINKWTLACNAIPTSNVLLDIEDMGEITVYEKKVFPAKIQSIVYLNKNVLEIVLRLAPNANFNYNAGQYVNIIKGNIKRSYSIANTYKGNQTLDFYIKKYDGGLMSKYWFNEAKENDLLRIEGPIGTFFLRETKVENIIFLATGTGVAPIKAILENINDLKNNYTNKYFWLFVGARYESDLFWNPDIINYPIKLNYFPVLSRATDNWHGEKGYIQNIVLKKNIDLTNAQVYACGSNSMITAAKEILVESGLDKKQFFSDAFVATN